MTSSKVACLLPALAASLPLVSCGDDGSHPLAEDTLRDAGPNACAAQDGRCQTADLPCPDGERFAGFDLCGDPPGDVCCVRSQDEAPRPVGAPCSNHDDCLDGHCARVEGATVCSDDCAVFDRACPTGARCHVPGDVVGFCLAACEQPRGACGLGQSCEGDGVCLPVECPAAVPDDGSPGCCFDDRDCDSGFACVGASCPDSVPGRCLPTPPLGTCWTDADCVPPRRAEVQRCHGSQPLEFQCTDTVTTFGTPGDCVAIDGG
jgi:hypothetical protein